jgi:hypothetical protein
MSEEEEEAEAEEVGVVSSKTTVWHPLCISCLPRLCTARR